MAEDATQQGAPESGSDADFDRIAEGMASESQANEAGEPASAAQAPETEPNSEPSAESEQEAAPTPTSFAEWAKSAEIDPEDILGLNYTLKVDGKDVVMPLRDVIKVKQLEGHVNNKSMELSNKLKEYEGQRQQWAQQVQAEMQRHQAVAQYAQNLLNSDFQKVDWNALRANDPVEYAAKFAEFQQRQGALNAYLQNVAQLSQQQQAQAQQGQQAKLAEERQATLNARPEWGNPETFAKDSKAMFDYGQTRGFTSQELNSITDHRVLLALSDAAQYAALKKANPEVMKQVRAAKPLVKPGARQQRDPKTEKLAAVMERANKHPRDDDARVALFDALGAAGAF